MAFIEIKSENQIPVGLLIFFLALSILFYVIYPPLRTAVGIYGFISLICLGIYTNPAFQDYLIGIPKNFRKTTFAILIGGAIGLAFVILPKVFSGFSMGVPLVPYSVDSNLKWIVICIFAVGVEELLTRGALLGLIKYMRRKDGISTGELWLAIVAQALFFMLLHLGAYVGNFYTAPTWLGAWLGISAVSASLIASFIFGIVAGWFVSLNGTQNLLIGMAAHFAVNSWLFAKMAVVGFDAILPFIHHISLVLNSLLSLI